MESIVSRVWIIGPLSWDSVLKISHLPELGGFVQGSGLAGRAGGTAANVAVGLANSGVKTGFVGYVGDDELSDKLVANLESSDIDSLHIKRLTGPANNVLILIDAQGERTIVGLTEDRLDQVTLRDAEISPDDFVVFVLWRNHFLPDLEYVKRVGARVIVGIEALEVSPLITANICIGSGSGLGTEFNPEVYLDRFERLVITRGAKGASQYWRENGETKFIHQPAIAVNEVVDTTGAGDSFLAGYIKGLMHAQDIIVHPMLIGAYWSAAAVSIPGSQPPAWEDVLKSLPVMLRKSVRSNNKG